MRPRIAALPAVLLASLALAACAADAPPVATAEQAASDAVLAEHAPPDGPGCTAAVAVDGEVAWAGARGLADVDRGIPLGVDSLVDFGSVSKQFTGLTVLRLAAAGELDTSDSLRSYLDDLPKWGKKVTIEEALHHTSGIPDYLDLLLDEGFDFDDESTQDDAIEALDGTDLEFKHGSEYSYSNSNYVLLAAIVEEVTGEDFADVVAREAIGDADLRVAPASPDVVVSYEDGEVSAPQWLQVGDGAIIGTPSAMAAWAAIYASDDPVVASMTEDAVDDDEGAEYGAGIGILPSGVLYHSGAWAGFVSSFEVSADRRTALVATCNADDLDPDAITSGLAAVWGFEE